jgi:hypothetical protein
VDLAHLVHAVTQDAVSQQMSALPFQSIDRRATMISSFKSRLGLGLALVLAVTAVRAGPLDPDCTAEKAAKSAAAKATVGVGGRCDPKEAAADTAKKATNIDDKNMKDRKDDNDKKNKNDKEDKKDKKDKKDDKDGSG